METKDVLTALAALAHETRLAIFRLLVEIGPEGIAVGKIGERLGTPPTTLSFHLKELANADLVTMRHEGRFIHIPPNLVVGPWGSHTILDTTTRYPHHVSSLPTAICMEMRHGTECQTDTPKPHHHRRFPR
jgi:ArsR family transcriptional regulator